MALIASAEDVRAKRRRASSNGTGFWLTTYIGANRYAPDIEPPPGPDTIYPMAFLVEQDADAVVGAHYHQADQFQVMVGGAGRLGTHDVEPGAVHFAGAWTAYGPLRADYDGLQYFTLRNGWDPGARYMEFPENRATLRAQPRLHREMVGNPVASDDGLCVCRYNLREGEHVTGPDPADGAGQFWLVLRGTMVRDRIVLPERSCVFTYPDEPTFVATAGAMGLTVQVMQFPKKS
jgi:hypothetical protein